MNGASVLCAAFQVFVTSVLWVSVSTTTVSTTLHPNWPSPPVSRCLSTTTTSWVWTLPLHFCVLRVLTPSPYQSTRSLTTSAPGEASWISFTFSIGCGKSKTFIYLYTSSVFRYCSAWRHYQMCHEQAEYHSGCLWILPQSIRSFYCPKHIQVFPKHSFCPPRPQTTPLTSCPSVFPTLLFSEGFFDLWQSLCQAQSVTSGALVWLQHYGLW